MRQALCKALKCGFISSDPREREVLALRAHDLRRSEVSLVGKSPISDTRENCTTRGENNHPNKPARRRRSTMLRGAEQLARHSALGDLPWREIYLRSTYIPPLVVATSFVAGAPDF